MAESEYNVGESKRRVGFRRGPARSWHISISVKALSDPWKADFLDLAHKATIGTLISKPEKCDESIVAPKCYFLGVDAVGIFLRALLRASCRAASPNKATKRQK